MNKIQLVKHSVYEVIFDKDSIENQVYSIIDIIKTDQIPISPSNSSMGRLFFRATINEEIEVLNLQNGLCRGRCIRKISKGINTMAIVGSIFHEHENQALYICKCRFETAIFVG